MTDYSVKFVNRTQSVFTLVVTVTLAGGSGLQSVAFQQVRSAPNGGTGTIRFNDSLGVCLATYTGAGAQRVYETNLTTAATAGSAWKVVTVSGVQQFAAAGNARFPDEIDVANASAALANVGLGLSSTGAVFQPDLRAGTFVPFLLPLSYWAILSSDEVKPGQVMLVSPARSVLVTAVLTMPAAIALSPATPNATVTATEAGAQLNVEVTYP